MTLELLREKIKAIEWSHQKSDAVFSFGTSAIDAVLPQGGLQTGAVHTLTGPYRGTLTAFCAALLGRIAQQRGPVLWCSTKIDLYPLGLLAFGLSPDQVLYAKLENTKELLWAVEEGLGTPHLGAVVAETGALPLSVQRRLQLCAQKSGVTLILLREASAQEKSIGTGVFSSWKVEPLPSTAAPGLWQDNGVGAPRMAVTLVQCRGAMTPQIWNLEWNATSLSFDTLQHAERATERTLAYCA